MDAAKVKAFQKALEAKLNELNIETGFIEGGGGFQTGGTLRALIPLDDGGGISLLEVMVTKYETSSDLLHFYTTMIAEIGDGFEQLKEAVLDWNLSTPLGAFGLFRPARQLYHKYSYPFPTGMEPEALADYAMYLITLLHDTLVSHYGEAVALLNQKNS